jgi:calcium-dependent protein kinase
MGNLCGGSD